jgi:hypothetical protein
MRQIIASKIPKIPAGFTCKREIMNNVSSKHQGLSPLLNTMQRARGHPWLSRVATCTLHRLPGHLTVVAFATKLPVHNLFHIDIIGTRLHLEDGWMADLTLKLHTMKPVRKDHRGHAPLLCLTIQNNVGIKSRDPIIGEIPEKGAENNQE